MAVAYGVANQRRCETAALYYQGKPDFEALLCRRGVVGNGLAKAKAKVAKPMS